MWNLIVAVLYIVSKSHNLEYIWDDILLRINSKVRVNALASSLLDVMPLDFFLLGIRKEIMYKEPSTTEDDTKDGPKLLIKASFKLQLRLSYDSQHFQHLL